MERSDPSELKNVHTRTPSKPSAPATSPLGLGANLQLSRAIPAAFKFYALVVQWIGRKIADLAIQVRLLARAPELNFLIFVFGRPEPRRNAPRKKKTLVPFVDNNVLWYNLIKYNCRPYLLLTTKFESVEK